MPTQSRRKSWLVAPKRIPSGVPGFDKLIGGGFLPGSIIMISGDSGAGKTVFALQSFLARKLSPKCGGLIISFEETTEEISGICSSLSFKLTPAVKIEYFASGKAKPEILLKSISTALKSRKAGAVFINSVTGIKTDGAGLEIFLKNLYSLCKQHSADAYLVFQGKGTMFPLGFIDAAVNLSIKRSEEKVLRSLQVLKMRGSSHEEASCNYEIAPSGVVAGFEAGLPANKGNEVNAALSFQDIEIDSRILQGFRKKHRHINLKLLKHEFQSEDYFNRMEEVKTAIRLGEFKHDIISCSLYEIRELAREKLILPISDYFVKSIEEDYFKIVREVCSYEGQLYSLPSHIAPFSLIYRKDIFKKHGVTVPKTSAELVEVLIFLLKKEKSFKHGMVFHGTSPLRHSFYTYFLTGGPDFKQLEGSLGEINNETGRKALQFMHDCVYKHKIAPEIDAKEDAEAGANRVIGGEALCTQGWAYSETASRMKKDKALCEKIGFETIPVLHPKASPVSIIHGGGYVIPVTSSNPTSAAEVIRYIAGYEGGKIIKELGNYPILSGRIDLWKELEKKVPYYMNAVKFLESAYSINETLQREEYAKIVLECAQSIFAKKNSPASLLDTAEARLKRRKRISFYYRAVEDAKKFIEQNHASKLKLADISKAVNLSSHFFSRMFRENSGKTVFKYLAEVRLDRAKKLLRENYRLNITQIAGKTGFSNVFHFATVFKKHTGFTPREYRLNTQESAGAAKKGIF